MFQESFPLTDKTCFLWKSPAIPPSDPACRGSGSFRWTGKEVACLKKWPEDFLLAAFDIRNWNQELSPGKLRLSGGQKLWNGAAETLDFILRDLLPGAETPLLSSKLPVILGSYSWQDFFPLGRLPGRCFLRHCRCLSSVWFPGWMEYALSQPIQTGRIYLSLGDKEERTKNQTMKTVGDNIRKLYQHYSAPDSVLSCTEELHHPQPEEQPSTRHFLLSCTLEWNPGGHFQHPEERTAQGFAWSMK